MLHKVKKQSYYYIRMGGRGGSVLHMGGGNMQV